MKKLNFEQMERINGGTGCGKIGSFFGVAAGVLMIAALPASVCNYCYGKDKIKEQKSQT